MTSQPKDTPRSPARILAVANQKGGVGKTTTSVNLATALAAVGKKVLLVDLDPQGNATTGFGIKRSERSLGAYALLFDAARVNQTALETRVPGLSIVPSSVHLAGAEIELVPEKRREYRLKNAFAQEGLDYDYILIDCPPSLNLLTLNALTAAHALLVPLQCEFYALEGVSQLVRTLSRVQAHFNPELELHGFVLTMYDRRNTLTASVARDVRDHFGDKVYNTVIPRNVRVSEAPSYGLPAIIYDTHCAGSQAYIKLAKELIKREKQRQSPVTQAA